MKDIVNHDCYIIHKAKGFKTRNVFTNDEDSFPEYLIKENNYNCMSQNHSILSIIGNDSHEFDYIWIKMVKYQNGTPNRKILKVIVTYKKPPVTVLCL